MQSKLINNRMKARQILAFDGLQWGRCRPTDLDFSMDWQQRTYIFCEVKTEGSPLTIGQRIHLEGLVDAIRAGGRVAYAIVACHTTPDSFEDVLVAECRTDKIYGGDKWDIVDTQETLSATIDSMFEEHKRGKGK